MDDKHTAPATPLPQHTETPDELALRTKAAKLRAIADELIARGQDASDERNAAYAAEQQHNDALRARMRSAE